MYEQVTNYFIQACYELNYVLQLALRSASNMPA